MATGSSGNASIISGKNENIAVDFGLSYKKWSTLLDKYQLKEPTNLFITHSHSDHSNISGLSRLMRVDGNIEIHTNRGDFETDDFIVNCFLVPHNVENHGLLVTEKATGQRLVYVTDCSNMYKTLLLHEDKLQGADIFALEANYDEKYLTHPEYLDAKNYRYNVFSNMMRHTSKQEALKTYAKLKGKHSKFVPLHMSSRFYNL